MYNHIKKINLPYTVVDVGWWYQIEIPPLPSGKIDYFAQPQITNTLVVDGNTPTALTDLRDIGSYVAAIIADPRTVNKYVLAYSEVWKPNDVHDRLEALSGEKIPRNYVSEAHLRKKVADADAVLKTNPGDKVATMTKLTTEYLISWGVRGDNTPKYAKYLGYLDTKDLYPDIKFRSFESFLNEVLDGKARPVYQNNEALQTLKQQLSK